MNQQLNLEHLVDGYYEWLRAETETKHVNGAGVISTPFVDRHNDFIQIYVLQERGRMILTDLGSTITDLEMSGCNMQTAARQKLLTDTLRSHGVVIANGNEISVEVNTSNFPLKKHQLLQAILSVNDIFYTARPVIQSLFFEDVNCWLRENEIRFSTRVSFAGKSGTQNTFDFLISASSSAPERLIKTITHCRIDNAKSVAFAWVDVKDTRPEDTIAYAFVNDENGMDDTAISVLGNYSIRPIPWTDRQSFIRELAA